MENLKSFLKIQNNFNPCDENAVKSKKNIQKCAYIFMTFFLKKWDIKDTKKCQKMPNKIVYYL